MFDFGSHGHLANSLGARRATNWGLTGEQRDVNLTNWGKQGRGIAFDKPFQLQILVTCKCCSALRGATPNEEGRFFDCCSRSAAFWKLGAAPPHTLCHFGTGNEGGGRELRF